MHLRRLCARPGCGAAATATLRFQPTLRQAWLVDLDESTARTQGDLCRRHAAALVLPRGWELHDQRTTGPRLVEDTPGTAKARARRVRVRKRSAEREPAVEPDQLPGFEPVVVTEEDVPVEPEPEPERASVEPEPERASVEPEPEPAPVVDAEAAAVPARSVPAQFGDDGDEVEVDDAALSTILDARTPLLQRAFRNAKPEPEPEPEPDADPEN
jgi:hypothetical protein